MMGFNASHGFESVYRDWDAWVTWKCGGWAPKRKWLQDRQFTALTDNPYRAFFEDMMVEYPNVKMILTLHPGGPEGWLNSTKHMYGFAEPEEKYTSWNQHVLDTVPKDRLLVFSPTQGFEPLASFLGLPAPQAAYPHIILGQENVNASRQPEFNARLRSEGCPDGSSPDMRW